MLAIFEMNHKVVNSPLFSNVLITMFGGRMGGRARGQGQTSQAKCSLFCSKAKGMLAIFEIKQKVVSDGRAGGQGHTSQTK